MKTNDQRFPALVTIALFFAVAPVAFVACGRAPKTPPPVARTVSVPAASARAPTVAASATATPAPAPTPAAAPEPDVPPPPLDCTTAHPEPDAVACEAGKAKSCYAFAYTLLARDTGVPDRFACHGHFLRIACDGGDGLGCFDFAVRCAGDETDCQMTEPEGTPGEVALALYTKALPPLRADCAAGRAGACAAIGTLHDLGVGDASDARLAAGALQKACKDGDGKACAKLADWMQTKVVPKIYGSPKHLLELGCKAGVASACSSLAGMSNNPAEEARWTAEACALGDEEACAANASFYAKP